MCRAFTLVEMMVSSTVFLMVVSGVLVGNSFGMRMMGLSQPKLTAAGEIRKTVRALQDEITSAKFVQIGNGDFGAFTNFSFGVAKAGNAIQVYPTPNTNEFVRYYLDFGDRNLKRMTNGAVSPAVVARAISNNVVFSGENHLGVALTNDQPNMAIHVSLQYFQMAGSTNTPIGPAYYYKSNKLETRFAWRER